MGRKELYRKSEEKRQKKKIFLPPHFLLRGPIIHFHDFFTKIDYIQI